MLSLNNITFQQGLTNFVLNEIKLQVIYMKKLRKFLLNPSVVT